MKMNNQNMYYPNYYYAGYNNYYNNTYNTQPYTAFYHPYNQNLPNYINNDFVYNIKNIDNKKTPSEEKDTSEKSNNINFDKTLENKKSEKGNFRIGPLDISKDRLSIFGFEIAIDDLILIALILFLFFETDCDYSILIVLGLMLFNISFSSLDFF